MYFISNISEQVNQRKMGQQVYNHVPFTILYVQKGLNPAVDIIYI